MVARNLSLQRGNGPCRPVAVIIAAAVIISCLLSAVAMAQDGETLRILDAGDTFFKALKRKDFKASWESLSKGSQEGIIAGTMAKIEKQQAGLVTRQEVESDFQKGSGVADPYWQGFLAAFNPDLALEESRWTVADLKRDSADIVIHYRKAKKPARLKMLREGARWKVGLAESFWK